jgi:hypothetical protein
MRPVLGDTISKITRAKWTGSMTQVVESLLCKCKAQSSNPSSTRKKKNHILYDSIYNILEKAKLYRGRKDYHLLRVGNWEGKWR